MACLISIICLIYVYDSYRFLEAVVSMSRARLENDLETMASSSDQPMGAVNIGRFKVLQLTCVCNQYYHVLYVVTLYLILCTHCFIVIIGL